METLGSLMFAAVFPVLLVPVLFSGANFIRAEHCFFFLVPMFVGNSLQQTMMLFISMERFLCVLCPIWHLNFTNQRKRRIYLMITTEISLAYALIKCTFFYIGLYGELAGREVTCLGDFYASWWKPISSKINLVLQVVTVIFYSGIWAIMVKGAITKVQVTNSYNMHLLKALSVIMAIIIFGYMQYVIVPAFLPIMKLNPEDLDTIVEMLLNLAVFASMTNGPVLYMFSSDYRRNFQKVFPRIFGDGRTTENSSTRPAAGQQQQAWQ